MRRNSTQRAFVLQEQKEITSAQPKDRRGAAWALGWAGSATSERFCYRHQVAQDQDHAAHQVLLLLMRNWLAESCRAARALQLHRWDPSAAQVHQSGLCTGMLSPTRPLILTALEETG